MQVIEIVIYSNSCSLLKSCLLFVAAVFLIYLYLKNNFNVLN